MCTVPKRRYATREARNLKERAPYMTPEEIKIECLKIAHTLMSMGSDPEEILKRADRFHRFVTDRRKQCVCGSSGQAQTGEQDGKRECD